MEDGGVDKRANQLHDEYLRKARIAEPQTSRRGDKLAEEGVKFQAISHIRKTLSDKNTKWPSHFVM